MAVIIGKPTFNMNNSDPLLRYERQLWMKSISLEGQKKIAQTSVLVVGAGGLGSPILFYLAAAGIGKIGIMDDDQITSSNLNRQILYTTKDLGLKKSSTAKQRIQDLNPSICVEDYSERLDQHNAQNIISKYSLLIDASDNYPTRYLINDTSVLLRVPLFFAAVSAWSGIFFARIPHRNQACFRCCYPVPLPEAESQDEKHAGIIGATAGFLGSLLCTQIIQYITQDTFAYEGKMLWVDLEKARFFTYPCTLKETCLCHSLEKAS